MRVKTDQSKGFADLEIKAPESELTELKKLIDWKAINQRLESLQGDYSALSLFKMLLLQTWHNLSDEGVSQAVKRDLVFMGFCEFSVSGNKPDATTLCHFRKRLVDSSQLEGLLYIVNADLESKNLKVANGKYLSSDATLIQSARRPRKVLELQEDGVEVTYSDDKDASWLQKGDQAIYGYSASVTTDEQGLVESVTTFSANRSEMRRLDEVLDAVAVKPGQVLLYDKGTDSKDNRALLKARGLKDGIMRKKPKGKPMSHWNRLRNKLIGRRRFVVERTFGTFKRTYGLNRARYLGLIKTQAEVILKSIAYNLKRAVNRYRDALLQPNCV